MTFCLVKICKCMYMYHSHVCQYDLRINVTNEHKVTRQTNLNFVFRRKIPSVLTSRRQKKRESDGFQV